MGDTWGPRGLLDILKAQNGGGNGIGALAAKILVGYEAGGVITAATTQRGMRTR